MIRDFILILLIYIVISCSQTHKSALPDRSDFESIFQSLIGSNSIMQKDFLIYKSLANKFDIINSEDTLKLSFFGIVFKYKFLDYFTYADTSFIENQRCKKISYSLTGRLFQDYSTIDSFPIKNDSLDFNSIVTNNYKGLQVFTIPYFNRDKSRAIIALDQTDVISGRFKIRIIVLDKSNNKWQILKIIN
jgi:hypothetical protein